MQHLWTLLQAEQSGDWSGTDQATRHRVNWLFRHLELLLSPQLCAFSKGVTPLQHRNIGVRLSFNIVEMGNFMNGFEANKSFCLKV